MLMLTERVCGIASVIVDLCFFCAEMSHQVGVPLADWRILKSEKELAVGFHSL